MNYREKSDSDSDSQADETFNSVSSNLSQPTTPLSPSNQNFLLQPSPPPTTQVLTDVKSKLKVVEAIQNVKPNWPPLEEEEVVQGHIQVAPELPVATMPEDDATVAVNFEDEDAKDGVKAIDHTRTLKIEYDPSDVKFWFIQLENEMFTCEVKSQWLKRCVLVKNLPPKVQSDVKALLSLQKSEAPDDLYKQIKGEILHIHAPKKEDAFKRALSRVLTGLPSQLGQDLINDTCTHPIKLTTCCCAHIVLTLWTLQLPAAVRASIADREFTGATYNAVFQSADKVYLSTKDTQVNPAVAAISGQDKSGEDTQVAALRPQNRNRGGRGGGRNRGGGGRQSGQQRQQQSSSSSSAGQGQGRGQRHSSNPPSSCCDSHYRYGDKSWNCLSPFTCPWKDKVTPRPSKKDQNSSQ